MTSKCKRYCSVPQCNNYKSEKISIHGFPKNQDLSKKWAVALRIGKAITKGMSVCSEHFVEQDFFPANIYTLKRFLKSNVIPSQKIPSRKHDIPTSSFLGESRSKRLNDRYSKNKTINIPESYQQIEEMERNEEIIDHVDGDIVATTPVEIEELKTFSSVGIQGVQRRAQPTIIKNAIPKHSNNTSPGQVNIGIDKNKLLKTCAACNSSELIENGQNISYYYFPINPALRKEWISAARLKNSDLTQFSSLCSKHFEQHCFDSVTLGVLKQNAIPSRFGSLMNSSASTSTDNTETIKIDLTEMKTENSNLEKTSPFCIVKSCNHEGNIRGITYHRIPKDNFETWMRALKCYVKIDRIHPDSRVCSMHFKAKDFIILGNKIKLNKDAVPKLHINQSIEPMEGDIRKLKQNLLISNVITSASDIVKSNFAVIDVNSIINQTLEANFKTPPQKSIENLTIIKAMHNYCDVQIINDTPIKQNNTVKLETMKSVSVSNENDEEDKKKKNLIRKLRAYKKAYKKHKCLNKKQSEKILALEDNLDEKVRKNKKLEQRIIILEDLIHNILKKREEDMIDMDSLE